MLTVGFSHFVASMTAQVASGWSGWRVAFSPTGKRRLYTANSAVSGHNEINDLGDRRRTSVPIRVQISGQVMREHAWTDVDWTWAGNAQEGRWEAFG